MHNEYIEPDRAYVAKQFNGPVISAVIKAIYSFLHKDVDHHCDYFKNLSIDNADIEQQLFIGKLMGVQLFDVFTDAGGGKYLTFQSDVFDTSELTYNNGWAEDYLEGSDDIKGVFGTGADLAYPIALTNVQYAKILNAVSQIPSASINSIFALDVIVNALTDSTNYEINYDTEYPDVINVILGEGSPRVMTTLLQGVFDRLFEGGSTILVSRR